MRLRTILLLAVISTALPKRMPGAQGDGEPPQPARIFAAVPGTNTLDNALAAVRTWRAAGHGTEPAMVLLSRGEYTLTAPLMLDSRDGNVSWKARDADHILILGGQRIVGFTSDQSGIWHAKTGLRFEQLFVNHRRATRARLPAAGFFQIQSVHQEILPDGKALLTVKLSAADAAVLRSNPGACAGAQILVCHKWDTSRYLISSVDTAAGTLTIKGEPMEAWNPWDVQSRFFLDNVKLARPLSSGTWFLDGQGNLSYSPLPGEQIGHVEFVAPTIEKFVEIHGATNLYFEGLRFQYTGYELPPGGCPPMQAAAAIEAAFQIDEARNVTLKNCEIAHTGNYGIWFRRGCAGDRIQHCLLEDLGAGGIRIGETSIRDNPDERTGGIIADNNIIRVYDRIHPSAVGVWIGQSANNQVTHNDISDAFYTAISVGWTWGYGPSLATNNFIGFNRIHQIGQGVLSDMGGIYTLGVSPGSASVGNVIFDVRAHDYGGWGIYPDEGSTGWRIESNLVWNCTCVSPSSGGGFHQHYGATNYIANNIFALSSGPPMQATRVENHLSFTLEHNLIISTNTEFFTGPWDRINFVSRSNCFVALGAARQLFPNGGLAAWQNTGHETGSILTNVGFKGTWPDVMLPDSLPALVSVGFKAFDPRVAGVYGDRAWVRRALVTALPSGNPVTP